MEINYTWKLLSLKKVNTSNLNDVIIQTVWEKIGINEDGVTGTFLGSTEFDLDSVDPNNFISYENLTEENVLGWVHSIVIEGYEKYVNKVILDQILEKTSAIVQVDSGFPWDSEPIGVESL